MSNTPTVTVRKCIPSKYNLKNWLKTQFLVPYPIRPPSANFTICLGRFCLLMDTGFQVPSSLRSLFHLSISGVLRKLGKAPFVASWIILSNSRKVNNFLFCSILSDTLVENWDICFRMYRRNASLLHLLIIIIVSGVSPARYILIAALERRECVPISIGTKPNYPLPRIWTAARNFVWIHAEVMANFFPFVSMKFLTWHF